jgi:hypothetical protein
MAEKANKATAKVLDFTNVKERGDFNPKHVEPGDYTAKITKVVETKAKDDEDMWVFTIVLDEHPRSNYPYYIKLVENQLWKLRLLFSAVGVNVGTRKVKIDPNKLVGKVLGVAMEDDEYEGRLKSVVLETFPVDEVGGAAEGDVEPEEDEIEEEEIEEPAPKKAAKKAPAKKAAAKKKPVVEEEDDEDEDAEEDDDELEIDEI